MAFMKFRNVHTYRKSGEIRLMKANVTDNLNPDVCTYAGKMTKPLSIWGAVEEDT